MREKNRRYWNNGNPRNMEYPDSARLPAAKIIIGAEDFEEPNQYVTPGGNRRVMVIKEELDSSPGLRSPSKINLLPHEHRPPTKKMYGSKLRITPPSKRPGKRKRKSPLKSMLRKGIRRKK